MVLFGVLWLFFVSLFANESLSTPAVIMADEVNTSSPAALAVAYGVPQAPAGMAKPADIRAAQQSSLRAHTAPKATPARAPHD